MVSEADSQVEGARRPDGIHLIEGVPIRNLWLLMFYASELFRQIGTRKSGIEEAPDDVPTLVAELLVRSVEVRLKRNLSAGYQPAARELGRVRGKIDFLETRRKHLDRRGRVFCRFDEFTVDTPRNRLVRAALDYLVPQLENPRLAHRCRSLSLTMHRMGIHGEKPSSTEIAAIRFGHHDKEDQLMIAAARLAFDVAIPTESEGNRLQHRLSRDPRWLRRLFENGIAGFYETVLSGDGWSVRHGKYLKWQIEASTSGIRDWLPQMQSDIILEHREMGRRIVIDTKFNSVLTHGRYDRDTLRSPYIYQIYAYLRWQEASDDPLSICCEGILLHPAINEFIDEQVVIQGHPIRFATVDLGATAKEIRQRLIEIAENSLISKA